MLDNVLATPHIGYVSQVLQDVLRRYRFEHSEVAPTPTKRVSDSSPCYFAFAMAATLALTARM
jgi:hypothetical protein